MAVEFKNIAESMLADMGKLDPRRKYVEQVLAYANNELRKLALIDRLRAAFGPLPDHTLIEEVIPPHLVILRKGKVREGDLYAGQTRREVHSQFPVWNKIYDESDPVDKVSLAPLTRLNSHTLWDKGFQTLGDIRHPDEGDMKDLSRVLGEGTIRMVREGFVVVESQATEV